MTTIRKITAYLAAPVMAVTEFRFSKDYRWGTSRFHRAVYAVVDTVGANAIAQAIIPTQPERTERALVDFAEGFNRGIHPDHAICVGTDADGLAHYTNVAL